MSDDVDPELAAWLAAARDHAARDHAARDEAPSADCGAMLDQVEAEIARAEAKPTFWLRTRSTFARRMIAIGAALTMVVVFGVLLAKRELGETSPLHLAVALGALGSLLGLSVHQALRPLHRPPPPRGSSAALTALTLIATLALALVPAMGAHSHGPLGPVSPCLFYGLLTGLPIYAILRLLDRGSAAPLLASCAAGLVGNLVLSLHCPSEDPEHLMLGHFSVALLFVAGLAIVHRLVRPRR